MRQLLRASLLALLFSRTFSPLPIAAAGEPPLVFNPDILRFTVGEFTDKSGHKAAAGTVEPAEGKFGNAIKFTFVEGASGGFMTGRLPADDAWNGADGLSFWVKGDGVNHWGGLELIDKDQFNLRFGYCFPIGSADWQKIVVPWRDMVPELAGSPISRSGGYAPAGLGHIWFGKWFYWRDYPAESYTIDRIALEQTIPLAPTPPAPGGLPLSRLRAKLAQHKPVTIVTMGDSLSDDHHWSNREILWSHLLAKSLKDHFGSEVMLVNPAIGGTTLSQNLVLMPRWVEQAPAPDLVTVWFGFNDWESGVRGPRFAEYLRLAVDRIRRQTGGAADILLMTTLPSHDKWESMGEMEQAVRDVAKEKEAALVDIAADFHKAASADEALKQEYWATDKVHLGKRGHAMASQAILKAIDAARSGQNDR